MARKRSAFGTLLRLGGLAAVGAVAYKNRELIRGFIDELTASPAEPEELYEEPAAAEAEVPAPQEERDIVIDRTAED